MTTRIEQDERDKAVIEQIKSLVSTDKDIVKILTEMKNLNESDSFGILSEIAINYDYNWLRLYLTERALYRISNQRKRETNIVDVLKALLMGSEEQRNKSAILSQLGRIFH